MVTTVITINNSLCRVIVDSACADSMLVHRQKLETLCVPKNRDKRNGSGRLRPQSL